MKLPILINFFVRLFQWLLLKLNAAMMSWDVPFEEQSPPKDPETEVPILLA